MVGKGHLRGIAYALSNDSGELRFKDLVGRMGSAGAAKQVARTATAFAYDVALGALGWVACDYLGPGSLK